MHKVVLILFLMILGAFVSRSVRRRRQRGAAALTALTTGNYGRATGLRGKFDSRPASKPVLWETRITPVDDEAKGWAGIFVSLLIPNLVNSSIIIPHAEMFAMVSL
jgi:hypothetical protein